MSPGCTVPTSFRARFAALLAAIAIAATAQATVQISWVFPAGGETLTVRDQVTLTWTATSDAPNGVVALRDVAVSYDDGTTWEPLAVQLYTDDHVSWYVRNKPSTTVRFRVVARDAFGTPYEKISERVTISGAPAGRLVPSTDRDFELPGTQPIAFIRNGNEFVVPTEFPSNNSECRFCHAQYHPDNAIYDMWRGSMMAHASIDPLFKAAMHINDRVAPGSGETCLRCHISTGWTSGRSNPSDGSAIRHEDLEGVSCDLCHRLVNPSYTPGQSPVEDQAILAELPRGIPQAPGNAMYVIDPNEAPFVDRRRGPFTDTTCQHSILISPVHQQSALCGTCHDVSNPAISLQSGSQGVPNEWDTPAPAHTPHAMMSEQRTYSEWLHSAYNTPEGVYAPQFGGNRDYVASCQDCHMRDATGRACVDELAPVRNNLPLHDLTGGNTWMLSILDQVDPSVAEPVVQVTPGVFVELGLVWLQEGIQRARYMLQNAAELTAAPKGRRLRTRVTNLTGHKLPTGYPEGRRMWLNVRFFDATDSLIGESGAYDAATGTLTHDAQIKVYEGKPVVNAALAAQIGLPANTPNYLALSNQWAKDNRIPPLGFTNAAYESFGGAPIGASYADGQNWDDTLYDAPPGAVRAEVRLFYQTISREYAEFLRDAGGPGSPGEFMYSLWASNDKAPPELMASATASLPGLPDGDMNCDGVVSIADIHPFVLAVAAPDEYAAQYPLCDLLLADLNQDGAVTVGDIGPFASLLLPE